tara:strand:+ start:1683 stop:2168 length:486 start_codon:yes stop_codon:yes gene_type:complete
MPTIAQLKDTIRTHLEQTPGNVNCPAYSRLRKADLEKLVEKLIPNAVFKPITKKIIKRPKTIFQVQAEIVARAKKNTVATESLARDIITPEVIKKIGGVASMLTGNNIRNPKTKKLMSSISRWLQEVIVRFGFDAQGDNEGGEKTIVDFWLNRIPDQVINI